MQKTLYDIAYARSGDKGAHSNIGVIAYSLEGFYFLNKILTQEKIIDYFHGLGIQSVEKYPMENLWAINFVLKSALKDGGSSSLRLDAQGKALGQALLEMNIDVPEDLFKKICSQQHIRK